MQFSPIPAFQFLNVPFGALNCTNIKPSNAHNNSKERTSGGNGTKVLSAPRNPSISAEAPMVKQMLARQGIVTFMANLRLFQMWPELRGTLYFCGISG